jgi:3-methyladenine DNA glycosylase AlkD
MTSRRIQHRLRQFASSEKAETLQGFFKTGAGQYGEGDLFLGIAVPDIRKVAKECREASLREITRLLSSAYHEERLLALLMLVDRFSKGDEAERKRIYELYTRQTRYINNWDLVDLSAPNIVGAYLSGRSRKPLYAFAKSRDLWKRRIAIMATFQFIKEGDFSDTLKLSTILLSDDHDLIHKAVGWMLRETGKRDLRVEERFLEQHYKKMPRTMLRYAIERFPETKRKKYLNGKV